MRLSRKLIIGATALAGAATLGIGLTQAASLKTKNFNPMGSLVDAIAQKFNLKSSDVQKVIDDQRALQERQMQAERAAREKAMLDQAVKDGKLIQAQEDLILAKRAESRTFQESLKNLSLSERQAKVEARASELKAWATANGIPEQYVMFSQGGMGRGPRGEGMGQRLDPKAMLDQAVKDGKLTKAQEDLILAKQADIQKSIEGLKDKDAAERQAAIKALTDDLKSWAKANNIPEQYVAPFGHGRIEGRGPGFGGRGGMMGWGQEGNQARN